MSAAPRPGLFEARFLSRGRQVSGLEVALVELESGLIVRGRTDASGLLRLPAPAGRYALIPESTARFVVSRGPRVVRVASARTTAASVELLSVGVLPLLAAAAPEAQITHQGLGCLLADQFPVVEASIQPAEPFSLARVYFRPARGTEFFYVEMESKPEGGFTACLPRPRLDARSVEYYVAFFTAGGEAAKGPQYEAIIVKDESACPAGKRVAPVGDCRDVAVFSAATGAAVAPAGFAAGSLALTAGTIAALAGGATAAGISAAVTVFNPVPTPEATPIPSVTPTPRVPPTPTPATPTPTPVPTPTPIPVTANK